MGYSGFEVSTPVSHCRRCPPLPAAPPPALPCRAKRIPAGCFCVASTETHLGRRNHSSGRRNASLGCASAGVSAALAVVSPFLGWFLPVFAVFRPGKTSLSRARHPLLHSPSLLVGISGPLNYSLLGDQVVRAQARFDATRRRHKPTNATTQLGDAECVATSRRGTGGRVTKTTPHHRSARAGERSTSPRSRSWALPEG